MAYFMLLLGLCSADVRQSTFSVTETISEVLGNNSAGTGCVIKTWKPYLVGLEAPSDKEKDGPNV